MRETVSALALGPNGWVQVANFVMFGLCTAASAWAWRATLAPGRGARAIPALKAVIAVGLIVAGLCVTDAADGSGASLHGSLHNTASVATLVATWCSSFMFAARFATEPGWRLWSVFAVLTGLVVIASLSAMGVAIAQHGDAGLFERLATVVGLPLGLAVTLRLLLGDRRLSPGH